MPLDHCVPTLPIVAAPRGGPKTAAPVENSWEYHCPRRSRRRLIAAIAFSAALHLVLGIGRRHHVPPKKAAEADSLAVVMVMPKLQDLQDPEPEPEEKPDVTMDPSLAMPTQPDLPRLALANDFIQKLDLSSLVQPDMSQVKLATIPEHFIRGGGKIADAAGIFDLAQLDRVPEASFQPPPVFPPDLKGSIPDAWVIVAFVVDASGRVVNARVIDSSHPGFENATVVGVSKWKFHPGMKAGRKVGARMKITINFHVSDPT